MSSPKDSKYELHLNLIFDRGIDLERRIIFINEEIEEGHSFHVDAAMTIMESMSKKKITVKINSYGGDVYETMAIISRIKSSTCLVETIGYGKIMSSGLLLLASGKKRKMCKWAVAMNHGASYELDYSKHEMVKNFVKQVEQEEKAIDNMLQDFTGTSVAYWEATRKYEDTYLTAQQCLQLGVVDEIF